MNATDRKKTLKIVEKIWDKNPELRLGQLLCNVGNFTLLYYISDAELETLLQRTYGPVDLKEEKKAELKKEVKETKTTAKKETKPKETKKSNTTKKEA